MFGSTVEHVLRSHTNEYKPCDGTISEYGSMHSFKKEFHPIDISAIKNVEDFEPNSITTPIYPFAQSQLAEILDEFEPWLFDSRSLLIYADCLRSAELNLLFQYYKIAIGLNKGLDIFCGQNQHNIVNWNATYTNWQQMRPWELREWFSLFYVSWVDSWIESCNQVPSSFLKVSNTELLFDTKNSLIKIIEFCNLTHNAGANLDQFVTNWQQKQSYIVQEFNLLDRILETTLNKTDHSWKDLNIISEAIIQQRLRNCGYEIRCDGLDIFPTDSISLYNLLEKC